MADKNNRLFPHVLTLTLFTLVAALGFFLPQTDAAEDTPRVSNVCLDCHDGYDEGLVLSPHQLPDEDRDADDAKIACTDCHQGDARHYEEDPEEYGMPVLSEMSAAEAGLVCSQCHLNDHQQTMMAENIHAQSDVNCSDCHQVHDNRRTSLLQNEQWDLCLSCHPAVEASFVQPYRHPVNDNIVSCSECHLSLDRAATGLASDGTNVCTSCHMEFEGPFPFEHQATLGYSTQEGGCMACHEPHGSAEPRMLKQPYEPPHFQLCTQCHSFPARHNFNQQHGDRFAGLDCNACHTDIHGSYVSSKFLSESLEAEGCFTSGCHPPGR